MRRYLVVGLAFGMVAAPMPARAPDVLRLPPASKWNLHYADDYCRLARNFGEGERMVTLVLDQFAPGEVFRILLAGDPVKPRRDTLPVVVTLRFGPNEAESEASALTGTLGDKPALFIGSRRLGLLTEAEERALEDAIQRGMDDFTPPPIGEVREAAATWFKISKALRNDIILETGPMDRPLAALRKCSWDTVAHWGLDVEQQKALTRRPQPKRSPSAWLRASDYPNSMLRGGYQSIVNFRLMVDETGRPTSCQIQDSTKPKQFDDAVCAAVMKRAQFEPALDAQGKPVPSFWHRTVHFRIG